MVSIALVDARKTSLTGVQNSKKNRLAATLLGHRRFAARGRCSASSLGLLFMVSIALVDARKTSLTWVQNSNKKNRLAATQLVDDAPYRHWVKPPPPLGKKLDPPLLVYRFTCITIHTCRSVHLNTVQNVSLQSKGRRTL